MLNIEENMVEIPLNLYCDIKNINKRTVYKKRNLIKLIKRGGKNYVLVDKNSIFIFNEEDFKLQQRRHNKELIKKLKNVQKNLNQIVFFLNGEKNNE